MQGGMNIFGEVDAILQHKIDEYLAVLSEFLSQPSVSDDREGNESCAEWLRDFMIQRGLDADIYETPGNPVVMGNITVDPDKPTILFYGHYDVQPPEPLEDWDSPPFSPVIRDGRIFARGSADDKGQILVFLFAIQVLQDLGIEPKANLKFIFEGEEEKGSPNLAHFAKEHKVYLAADLALAVDGNKHYSGKPTLIFGVRGGLWVEILITTSEREIPSAYGHIAPNAATEIAKIVGSLRVCDGSIAIPSFYDNIQPPSATENEWLADLDFDMQILAAETGLENLKQVSAVDFYRDMMFTPSLSITGMMAGYVGEGFKASVPHKGSIKIDIRPVANQDPDEIFQNLSVHIKRLSKNADIKLVGKLPPSRTDVELYPVKWFIKSFKDIVGTETILIPSFGGSGPHYIFLDIIKAPLIWLPLAQPDCNAHAANENLSLTAFREGISIIAGLLTKSGLKG